MDYEKNVTWATGYEIGHDAGSQAERQFILAILSGMGVKEDDDYAKGFNKAVALLKGELGNPK